MRTIIILFLAVIIAARAQADALDTWTNVVTSPYGDIHQIAFGNGQFKAVSGPYSPFGDGSGGPTGTAGSSDGLHWGYGNSSYGIDGVVFGNATFVWSVSFGDGGEIMWLSPTNSGSYLGGSPTMSQLNCVAFGNGVFVAVGFEYEGGGFGSAYISTNGQIWSSEIKIATNFFPGTIAYGNGVFVAVGSSQQPPYTNMMFESLDNGRTWYNEAPYIGFSFSGISFVNGLFATLGPNGTYYTCPDPDVYDFTAAGSINPNLYVLTSGTNHIYVGVGTNGGVYTSTNRTTWTQRITGITNNLTCLAYGDNRFVATGSGGKIFVSGSTVPQLSVQNQSPAGTQLSLTGGLGPTYHLQASSDLSSWTNLVVFTNIGPGTNYLDTTASNFTQRYYRTVSP